MAVRTQGERRFQMNGIRHRLSVEKHPCYAERPIRFVQKDGTRRLYQHLSPEQALRLARALESAAREARAA
jgi:hypothetical protein